MIRRAQTPVSSKAWPVRFDQPVDFSVCAAVINDPMKRMCNNNGDLLISFQVLPLILVEVNIGFDIFCISMSCSSESHLLPMIDSFGRTVLSSSFNLIYQLNAKLSLIYGVNFTKEAEWCGQARG